MIQRVFVDANVINDIYDETRRFHEASYQCLAYCLEKNIRMLTSCDIVTTVYYITTKVTDSKIALKALKNINDIFGIVPFDNRQLSEAIALMQSDSDYTDLEDSIQYIMARESACELILTNDAKFVSKDMDILNSSEFIQQWMKNKE